MNLLYYPYESLNIVLKHFIVFAGPLPDMLDKQWKMDSKYLYLPNVPLGPRMTTVVSIRNSVEVDHL